jgi:hypothetical protein
MGRVAVALCHVPPAMLAPWQIGEQSVRLREM